MIILLHVLIALSGMVVAGFAFLSPSKKKIVTSYVFVAATIISGSYLVVLTPSSLVSACLTGLVYLGFVMSGVLAAQYKLVRQKTH